jgi:hypothetical protein
VRLFGAPSPQRFTSTAEGKTLAATAALHYSTKRDVDRLLALEKLVLDIMGSDHAARAFAANPREFLNRSGLGHVKLDLNTQEVRIAMAMGDPAARQAAMNGDVVGFVDAILAQGIKPSVGVGRFVHVEALVHSSVVAYFIAAVVTYQKIATATAIPVVVIGPRDAAATHMRMLTRIAERIGDRAFARKLASPRSVAMIAKYTALAESRLGPGLEHPTREE